jgi:hypothetical protein
LPVVNIHFLNDLLLGDLRALKLPLQAKYQQFSANNDGFSVEPWRVAHLLGIILFCSATIHSSICQLCNFSEGWRIPIKITKEAWKVLFTGLCLYF